MFSNAITLFKIAGFSIRIDPSGLLIAGLITWSLSTQYLPDVLPGQSGGTYVVMAVAGMLGFFASLILHELAHSLVARRVGVTVKSIILFVFGGMAEMTDDMPSPGAEAQIALAGPAMSVALAGLFWIAARLLTSGPQIVSEVLDYLAMINGILAVFNLLPAFPMDGGRILRAWFWQRSNNLLDATRRAAGIGSIFGAMLMFVGMLNALSGQGIGGVWFILIGGFMIVSSRSGYQHVLTQATFKDKTVAVLMTQPSVTVDPNQTLTALVNEVFLRHRISFVPVIEDKALLGHIDTSVLTAIDRENWDNTRVGDVFVSLDKSPVVAADLPVIDLMTRISQTKQRKFMVCVGRRLLGVITLTDLLSYLIISQSLSSETKLDLVS